MGKETGVHAIIVEVYIFLNVPGKVRACFFTYVGARPQPAKVTDKKMMERKESLEIDEDALIKFVPI